MADKKTLVQDLEFLMERIATSQEPARMYALHVKEILHKARGEQFHRDLETTIIELERTGAALKNDPPA